MQDLRDWGHDPNRPSQNELNLLICNCFPVSPFGHPPSLFEVTSDVIATPGSSLCPDGPPTDVARDLSPNSVVEACAFVCCVLAGLRLTAKDWSSNRLSTSGRYPSFENHLGDFIQTQRNMTCFQTPPRRRGRSCRALLMTTLDDPSIVLH